MSPEQKNIIALHESGHALCGWFDYIVLNGVVFVNLLGNGFHLSWELSEFNESDIRKSKFCWFVVATRTLLATKEALF